MLDGDIDVIGDIMQVYQDTRCRLPLVEFPFPLEAVFVNGA